MKQKTGRLLWAAALLLLAAVLVLVNLPRKPAPVGGTRIIRASSDGSVSSDETPAEESNVPQGAQPGQRLPDFTVPCLDGSAFTLSAQRGKVVVINLWATWCTPCVRELPGFDRLQREMPGKLAVLAVHAPPVTTDLTEYLSSYDLAFAVDEDGSLSALLDAADVLPQTVVIGPDGIVTCNRAGSLDYEALAALVAAASP